MATRWWKNFEDIFIRFGAIHARDGQMDRQTPGDSIYRAHAYASRGKNAVYTYVNGNIAHLKQQISEELGLLVVLHVDIYAMCPTTKIQFWYLLF